MLLLVMWFHNTSSHAGSQRVINTDTPETDSSALPPESFPFLSRLQTPVSAVFTHLDMQLQSDLNRSFMAAFFKGLHTQIQISVQIVTSVAHMRHEISAQTSTLLV